MREKKFRARDKKVQKMTRDGLAEKNLAEGTVQNISSRTADQSFARKREEETAGRAESRTQKKKKKQGMRAQGHSADRKDFSPGPEENRHLAGGDEPEVRDAENAAVSMQDAEDGRALSEPEADVYTNGKLPAGRRCYALAEKNHPARRVGGHTARLRRGGQEGQDPLDEQEEEKPSGKEEKREPQGGSRSGKKERGRLHFEEEAKPGSDGETREGRQRGQAAGKSRRNRGIERAERRVRDAEGKLEKAKERLPAKRRIHLQKQYNSASGKVKHRLGFEPEAISEYETFSLPKQAGKTAWTAAALKAHQKFREAERDNAGVEAAHKSELAAERAGGRLYRSRKRRLHEKPYREMRAAERRLAKAGADLAYRELLRDNPELKKKALAKWFQKQKIRRGYAAAAREAQKSAQHVMNVQVSGGQAARALAQQMAARKTVLGIVGIAVLLVAVFGSLASSGTAMLSGIQSAVIATCYVADDRDINGSGLKYTELETGLQLDINHTQENHPGYDEYRYSIGEIGHSPYELMAYLTAVYDAFTYAQVEAELQRLFGLQYRLTREAVTETRTYTDDGGNAHTYEWHILQTTLAVQSLSSVISGSLLAGDQRDRYGVYMQTCGNRQCCGNPFDFSWIPYVTSPYGYRVHPTTGEKDLHRGVDIGVQSGTPIKAVQDGRVLSAGDAGAYGLCVVIEGADGYRSRYAHCSSLLVNAGQDVARGDVIAAVGSTGSSSGPHLHLEVTHNGEYLNPYYFVDNGGTSGSPAIPEDPGGAMGDGSFAAMLAEAEKYLGFPYVWGGSSPSTSFDCSGFVSWVINQSGVGNVGRQTAQGLYNLCTPVSKADLQPGDLVFFTGTYSSANPVTHVGIYVGGGRMIHCGNPISYASINTNYWITHFYSGGRLP